MKLGLIQRTQQNGAGRAKIVSMIRKYHNHTPQTTPRHLEEEPLNHHESKDTDGVLLPCNRGQRLIVVHACSEDIFIPGASLIYKAALYTGDYHNEMNAKNFTK